MIPSDPSPWVERPSDTPEVSYWKWRCRQMQNFLCWLVFFTATLTAGIMAFFMALYRYIGT